MSKSKMTAKEFKRICTECGYDFEVWGFDGILNELALLNYKQMHEHKDESLKNHYRTRARKLTRAYANSQK